LLDFFVALHSPPTILFFFSFIFPTPMVLPILPPRFLVSHFTPVRRVSPTAPLDPTPVKPACSTGTEVVDVVAEDITAHTAAPPITS
jgi:hypothetical protein